MRDKLFFYFFTIVSLTSLLFLSACSDDKVANDSEKEGRIIIVTTIAQIGEPLSVIGGEHVYVDSLMGPGVDPHLYKATQGDIARLDEADIVFYNGHNLEGNMSEVFAHIGKTRPTLAVAEMITDGLLLDAEGDAGALDPHLWFDISLWKQALDAAVDLLVETYPEIEEDVLKNKEAYFADMDELEKEAVEKLAEIPESQRVLVTAHDAFGYFGSAFNIEVIGLQGLSTDDEIGLSDIQETIDIITEYHVPAVFVETSVSENSIRAVIEGAREVGVEVELGGELYSDAMGAAGTEEGTYLGMYRHNVKTIYDALMD